MLNLLYLGKEDQFEDKNSYAKLIDVYFCEVNYSFLKLGNNFTSRYSL